MGFFGDGDIEFRERRDLKMKTKKTDKIVTGLETIDRAKALEYLQKRAPHQRSLRLNHVESLAGEMIRGEWKLTGQPIIFDEHDKLIDGQHRMEAVVLSGVAIQTMVTRGIAPVAYNCIDGGIVRSVADNNSQIYAREQTAWLNRARLCIANTTTRLTSSMLIRYQEEEPGSIGFGIEQMRSRSPFNKANVLGVFVLAHPTNPTKVEEFFNMLRSDDVSTGDKPLFTLRVYLQNRYREDVPRDVSLKVLRCIKAHIDGEKIASNRLYAVETTTDYFGKHYPADSVVRQR